jgi:flagellar L-ring protein precursor FlgH
MAMSSRVLAVVVLAVTAALAGCQSAPKRDPAFAPVRPQAPTPAPKPSEGAIFAVEGTGATFHEVGLFTDQRARRVGDLLTIRLVEQTEAEKESETDIQQDSEFSVPNPTLLGGKPSFGGGPLDALLDPAGEGGRYSLETGVSTEKDFSGTGETTQSNRVRGDLSVTVSEVLPNGNLVVQGEKVLTLNRGNEYVRFSGIVRPADIDADNTVESTRVANATVHYTGDGEVAEASAMSWLGRFFLSVVFPF